MLWAEIAEEVFDKKTVYFNDSFDAEKLVLCGFRLFFDCVIFDLSDLLLMKGRM